ncbi:transposase [Robertmurraya siralis]|uniref:Transposase n=1 Tax=Robertmurraya siralis TaxID=77777 RepID=A0A920BUI8_9BACI|nr:transposase [Robertmurraya siralis]
MAKFTGEDKLQAVTRYLNGKESSREIVQSLGTDHKAILKWVKPYEFNGLEAFIKPCVNYPQQFKLDVLNYMIEHGTSLNETAAIFKIPAPSTIMVWRKLFETQGLDALRSKKTGCPSMKKEPNQQHKKTSVRGYTDALEARIKKLEMENEYLKKLNALVQNKEKSPNKTKRK